MSSIVDIEEHPIGTNIMHVRSNGVYDIKGRCMMKSSDGLWYRATIYENELGVVFVRRNDDFKGFVTL